MYHMCDQTEDRGTKIKSKLDLQVMIEKTGGEKFCLFQDMRSTGEFDVVWGTNNSLIWSGKGAMVLIVGILDAGWYEWKYRYHK